MRQFPRAARAYVWAIWVIGGAALVWGALGARPTLGTDPAGWLRTLLPATLFAALAALADRKQLRLRGANYSVATATNFACAVLLGPHVATWVGATGALAGDVLTRKPAHKAAFNTAALAISVAAGAAVMDALRRFTAAPSPADLPAFGAYALVNTLVNQLLVCTVIALASRSSLRQVLRANYRGVVVPIVALYPLGVLMAVVYAAFGGWIGLLLLVLPAIAAYAALEHARELRDANEDLRTAHVQLTASKDEVLSINKRLREALADLEAAQEQVVAQERLRALGQMASGIAHDFNNALAPVVGFTELLLLQPERWKDEAFMRRTLGLVNTAGQDAAKVVRQLREFYRKSDAEELLLPLDLNALARQIVDITEPRWRGQALAGGATISVTTELAALPPVLGDEAALREALTNLIFNAVDAMPQGGTLAVRTSARGNEALLEVVDGGTGMTDEVRRRCLDPFFTTKGVNGTGLGLSMVHGIARRHGGALEIETAWGHGTTMRLALPGCASQQRSAPESVEPMTAEASAPGPRPLRVLVVDDEPAVRAVLTAYLASYGFTAETAVNGHEGLLRFREARATVDNTGRTAGFDVVLTDRAMPEMNGDHLARAIKQIDAAVPVVMLTGFGDMLNALDQKPSGVDEVLGKPVGHAALRETLHRLTTHHSDN